MALPPTTNDFRRKLGYYLCGLAIGLVLLGFFQLAKKNEASQRAQPPVTSPQTPSK